MDKEQAERMRLRLQAVFLEWAIDIGFPHEFAMALIGSGYTFGVEWAIRHPAEAALFHDALVILEGKQRVTDWWGEEEFQHDAKLTAAVLG